jgi:glycosyltransferase involved in cell wall biosynthesis
LSNRVAVIITTRNSAQTVENCLLSVRNQCVKDVNIVVVDNFSTDCTPDIARRYATHFVQAGPERSRQRNVGARATDAQWLLFLDSDMILPINVLEQCLAESTRGYRVLVVPEVSIGVGYWAACKALERACYVGDESIEAARWFARDMFDELGGFDEELTGEEDWDLTVRARAQSVRVGRTDQGLIHDERNLSLRETMRTKYYYGHTWYRYARKHPRAAQTQMSILRPAFLRHSGFLTRHPFLSSGMLTMKFCEAVAGGVGALLGWWSDRRR